jgi:hypothetical protein
MQVWTSEALFSKASHFYSKAQGMDSDSPEYGLFLSLALEVLSRAALSNVSPVLNADPQHNEGDSILFALGLGIRKGPPRSIPFHSVSSRLVHLIEDYQKKNCRSFSDFFSGLRNEELHSGGSPFSNQRNSKWLPEFYRTAKILCDFMEKDFQDLVGEDLEEALHLISELEESETSRALEKIGRAKDSFDRLSNPEKVAKRLEAIADPDGKRRGNTTATCPACASQGVLHGLRIKASEPKYENSELFSVVTFRAAKLTCKACGLELSSTADIISAGLNVSFTDIEYLDLHDYFQPEHDDGYMNM